MNFSPGMFEQFKNMDPSMMKGMSDMVSGMSDNDIKNYLKMAGMGHMTPEMFRSSASMMKNMDPAQLNQMKDMATKMGPNLGQSASAPSNSSASTQKIENKSTTSQVSSQYPKIEKLKTDGNDAFKQGKYDQASASYFEAILDIEELRMKKDFKSEELDLLEISCRLNYSNVKAKLNDFEIVLSQAKQVLKIQSNNGKGLFRLGQAYYHLKKYELALSNLQESAKILKDDETVTELVIKSRQAIDAQKPKRDETHKEEESSSSKPQERKKSTGVSKEKPAKKKKDAPELDESLLKEIVEKKKEPEAQASVNRNEQNHKDHERHNHHDHDNNHDHSHAKEEVKISDETIVPKTETLESRPTSQMDDKFLKGQEEMKKMSSDQMKNMTDYMKNMDSSFIKQMLKSQTGMDLGEAEIENMKKMMNPDTLSKFANMDPAMLKFAQQNMQNRGAQGTSANVDVAAPIVGETNMTATATMPNIPDLASLGNMKDFGSVLGSEQMANMVDMLSQNPQMIGSMMGMLGDNHPMASMLKNKKPEDLAKWLGYLSKLMRVFGKASPLFSFLKKYYKHLAVLFICFIVYRYFM